MSAKSHPSFPPGPTAPKLWQLARTQQDYVGFMNECAERYGPIFTVRIHPIDRMVVVTRPDDLGRLFRSLPERFVRPFAPGDVLGSILGSTSIFMTTGQMHRRQRRLLKPSLRGDLIVRWAERMLALASEELKALPTGRPVGMRQPMRDVTLDVICRLIFGVDDPKRVQFLRDDISTGVSYPLALLLWFPSLWKRNGRLNPLYNLRHRRLLLLRMLTTQIEIHRADPDLEDRDDALSLMIRARDENGQPLSHQELCDQLLTLLAAGNESTAVALAWAIERLSRNPESLDRLMSELVEGKDRYLDAVINETLRTRPPVLDAVRTATEDIEFGEYLIPKGTLISAAFTVTHTLRDVWSDPHTFRPERFLEGQSVPYSHVPFGGGVHRCLGASFGELEMRIVIKELLRRFRIEAAPGPEEKIRLHGLTLVPARGAQVILQPRKS
ncbi:MAG TPA: cytochrome P450 [Solirubrobacterales bacterium]